jgi:branched-chain amino acid aminotransferase
MSVKVWIDGRLVEKEQAKISVFDHGLLYGDGVFEGIRVYNGRLFEWDAHIRRLFDSAKSTRLAIPNTPAQIKTIVEETIRANGFTDCYIRLIVTRGIGALGVNPASCSNPSTIVIADKIEMYSRDVCEKGMSLITASVIRNHPSALSPRIKSLNYLNNILAKLEALDAGVAEAIMLNGQGNVAECTADNIYIVRDGTVLTPTSSDGILEGITRKVIFTLCDKMGIPMREQTIQRHDLYIAEECFISGTGAEIAPVVRIDGRNIGAAEPGPITKRIMDAFHRHVREA